MPSLFRNGNWIPEQIDVQTVQVNLIILGKNTDKSWNFAFMKASTNSVVVLYLLSAIEILEDTVRDATERALFHLPFIECQSNSSPRRTSSETAIHQMARPAQLRLGTSQPDRPLNTPRFQGRKLSFGCQTESRFQILFSNLN